MNGREMIGIEPIATLQLGIKRRIRGADTRHRNGYIDMTGGSLARIKRERARCAREIALPVSSD